MDDRVASGRRYARDDLVGNWNARGLIYNRVDSPSAASVVSLVRPPPLLTQPATSSADPPRTAAELRASCPEQEQGQWSCWCLLRTRHSAEQRPRGRDVRLAGVRWSDKASRPVSMRPSRADGTGGQRGRRNHLRIPIKPCSASSAYSRGPRDQTAPIKLQGGAIARSRGTCIL
jgi:hypothetical protein